MVQLTQKMLKWMVNDDAIVCVILMFKYPHFKQGLF